MKKGIFFKLNFLIFIVLIIISYFFTKKLIADYKEVLAQDYFKYKFTATATELLKNSSVDLFVVLLIFVIYLFVFDLLKRGKFAKIAEATEARGEVLFFNWVSKIKYLILIIMLASLINCVFVLTRKPSLAKRPSLKDSPNIILIVIDTLRVDHVSYYGYQRKTTPHIDNLAETSILFENCFSVAPWTTPSIGSILTSQYPTVLGIEWDPVKINKKFLTLAEILRENSYLTAGIISHLFISSKLNFDQGFSLYDEENARGHDYISSPSITEKAIDFLRKNRSRKFFLFLHYFDPHYDYILHDKYNYYPDYKGKLYSGQQIKDLLKLAPSMSPEDIKYVISLYDSEISFTDEYIGKLLNEIKRLGLYDNSLIILTGDHGEEFLERGDNHIGHTKTLYKELIHVPLIIKLPYQTTPRRITRNVSLIDLMPTVLDIVGLGIPKKYKHFGKAIKFKKNSEIDYQRDTVFFETKRMAKLNGVVKDKWKCIIDFRKKRVSLFDLQSDPWERENVSQKFPQVVKELVRELEKWQHLMPSKKLKGQKVNFTERQKQILRSLGYIK
ncbi:MAG: sulfatase [Candidatus Aminicenantes bacterium]|nr:sulfatase [Candidatus Aminicenantes bacterium]